MTAHATLRRLQYECDVCRSRHTHEVSAAGGGVPKYCPQPEPCREFARQTTRWVSAARAMFRHSALALHRPGLTTKGLRMRLARVVLSAARLVVEALTDEAGVALDALRQSREAVGDSGQEARR